MATLEELSWVHVIAVLANEGVVPRGMVLRQEAAEQGASALATASAADEATART